MRLHLNDSLACFIMETILFLILRKLRRPLILIIVSFGIAVAGLTLMPGIDDHGKTWHMTIFQAFYVISYTATTIGYGEVPYAFSQAQRLWMTFSIYLTVIPWFYAIGRIVTLLQDTSLRQASMIDSFTKNVRAISTPFYILCSYGESASLLAKTLDQKGIRVVVIESQQERLYELELSNTKNAIPTLCGDAKLPENLIRAGVHHPLCSGVVTLTDSDEVNLAVAIAVKLMNANIMVIARAERDDIAANMASFGTDHIINPYTLFGEQLAIRVHAIGTFILHEWLTSTPGSILLPPQAPPKGKWIVCGYGRFGKSVISNLNREKISTTIVEASPDVTGCENCIIGSGTEAKTLIEANIKEATGIIAGTDNDINNLSIIMTAYELNPNLFMVIRRNKRHNSALFNKLNANITMQPTDIIAHECLAHMISPFLAQFLALTRTQSNEWARTLISQLVSVVGENVPETWCVEINQETSPAILKLIEEGVKVKLEHLMLDPKDRQLSLDVVPLMISQRSKNKLNPSQDTILRIGDSILLCGTPDAKLAISHTLNNIKTLSYIIDGIEIPRGIVWHWISELLNANKKA
jgi:voltage-gated potassium channel